MPIPTDPYWDDIADGPDACDCGVFGCPECCPVDEPESPPAPRRLVAIAGEDGHTMLIPIDSNPEEITMPDHEPTPMARLLQASLDRLPPRPDRDREERQEIADLLDQAATLIEDSDDRRALNCIRDALDRLASLPVLGVRS